MHSLATPSLHAAKRVKMGQRKAVVDLLIRLLGMTVMPISPLLMEFSSGQFPTQGSIGSVHRGRLVQAVPDHMELLPVEAVRRSKVILT
jgi:hypothetical protein